jgi:hypothetical protein
MKKMNPGRWLLSAVAIFSTMLISWKPSHETTLFDRFLSENDQATTVSLAVSDREMVDRFLDMQHILGRKILPPPVSIYYYMAEYTSFNQQLVMSVGGTVMHTENNHMTGHAPLSNPGTPTSVSVDVVIHLPIAWTAAGNLYVHIYEIDNTTSAYTKIDEVTLPHNPGDTPKSSAYSKSFTATNFSTYYIESAVY